MAVEMRSLLISAITLALATPVLADRAAAGDLVPGGWLMPPRVPVQAAPPPPMPPPPPPMMPAPVVRRSAAPPQPTRPVNQRQAPRPPSDGRVQF
jgi:hypothetical protein